MAEVVDQGRKRLGGRSARVRNAVLTAAFELLADKGFDNFTIGEVAIRAGVHETSIYRRWGSRQVLALDASLRVADDAIAIPDTGTLRSDLMALIARIVGLLKTPQGRAMLALIESRDDHGVKARRAYWQNRFERLRPMLARAVARGEFPNDADPMVFIEMLIAPLYFRLLVSAEALEDWPVSEQIDRLLIAYTPPSDKANQSNSKQTRNALF